ncbi:kinetochore-associated protein 1-like [Lingula anatina]|uniref:Kinetochore-associated protein 1-like n=1 Tax=Lingula anatina TaxID=7574 RepID=A0A1S3K1C5_LINAN|nr:kinetochore-associated protein 1-like [Lingula anatina]|eukprot:XP_013416071.1 kinetochore-associated protein 1-like [Lingula anatina]
MAQAHQRTILSCRKGAGEAVLSLWYPGSCGSPVQIVDSQLLGGDSVVKCRTTSNGKYTFVLDMRNILNLWDVVTLTMVMSWPQLKIKDFCLIETAEGEKSSGLSALKMAALTVPNDGKCILQVLSLPAMKATYELQLSAESSLAEIPATQESIFVVEGISEENGNGLVTQLRIRSLSEAQPETRFYRILHKNQFEEAEQFAKMFGMDVELVYKVKSSHILDRLSPWNIDKIQDEAEVGEIFSQLMQCLELIKDDAHIVECCVNAAMPTFEATLEMLSYARTRLKQSLSDMNGYIKEDENLSKPVLMTKVLDTLHRLDTYQVAFGIHSYRGSHWEEFKKTQPLREILKWLQRGNVSCAFTIWNRHCCEFEENFSKAVLADILGAIPEDVPSDDIKPWLKQDFFPFVIRILPEELGYIAGWLEQRARNLELLEKMSWPANALEMAELLHSACSGSPSCMGDRGQATPGQFATQVCNLSLSYSRRNPEKHSEQFGASFEKLYSLICNLRDLLSLHTKYNCKLSLAQYMQETTESLTYRMLDRVVAIELIPDTIRKVIRPYMNEHNLKEDQMLFQYIEDLLTRTGQFRSDYGEAPWEAKAIAVIGCIKDPGYKCQGILKVMLQAYIPWTPATEALVQEGLALDHPRVAELKELCGLIELKGMLARYQLRHFNTIDSSKAEILMKYILSLDKPTAMEDALKVVKTYDSVTEQQAYACRIRFLISGNRIDECVELLKSLPTAIAVPLCKITITGVQVLLGQDWHINPQAVQEEIKLFTKAGTKILRLLLGMLEDPDDIEEHATLLKDLTNLYALQEEFGEFVLLNNFSNADYRKDMLTRHVRKFFEQRNKNENASEGDCKISDPDRKSSLRKSTNFTHIYRLAEVLGFSKETLRGQIALAAATRGDVTTALGICSELYEQAPSEETAEVLLQVGHTVCKLYTSEDWVKDLHTCKDLPSRLHELARWALVICPPDMIADCLELSKNTALMLTLYRQCESGAYGERVQSAGQGDHDQSGQDLYKQWTFDPFFEEDGLVLDSSVTLTMAAEYAITLLPKAERGKAPYLQHRIQGQAKKASSNSNVENTETVPGADTPLYKTLNATALDLVQYLRENSQFELALNITHQTIGSVLQHHSIQTMGYEAQDQALKTALNEDKRLVMKAVQIGLVTQKDLVSTLFCKLFTKKHVDHILAVGYICSLQNKKIAMEMMTKLTRQAGLNYKTLLAIATVGKDYAVLSKEPKVLLKCNEMAANAKWGHKFSKFKISFKEAYEGKGEEKRKLIPQLVHHEQVELELIGEYCRAFNLDENEALFEYLEALLLGKSHLTVSARHRMATRVIEGITAKDKLLPKLNSIVLQIDPYAYEELDYMLIKINELDSSAYVQKGLKLLEYLSFYVRSAPPSDYEINYKHITEDEQLLGGGRALAPLSEKRLPFHPLLMGEPWKIITPELNASTVSLWLPITQLLKLNTDQVYLTTIQNIIKKHVEGKKAKETLDKSKCSWNPDTDVDLKLFDSVRKLLLNVSHCEMAVACGRWVVQELPMGAEKVVALKFCAMLAQKWLEVCPQEGPEKVRAQEAYSKFSQMWCRLATEQVLYQNRLAEEELLSLAPRPTKLIMKLYDHPSILQRMEPGAPSSLPDIHKIADSVAEVNKVNVSKIRLTLVEKWMPSASQAKQEEEDTVVPISWVTYLLQHGLLETNALFLLNCAFKETSNKINHMSRIRALRCLLQLVDMPTIERLSGKKEEEIKGYLHTLLYLVELEKLHVPHTRESFESCNKEGLVRGLWRNHSHEKKAVRLIVDLCLDFEIFEVQLWNSVLQQLLAFGMMEYLCHVLVCLSGVPELWQVSCIQKMWKSVLFAPLSSAVPPLSYSQQEECAQSLILLHRCPVLLDMDLQGLCKQYVRLEMQACALACLLMIPAAKSRQELIEISLKPCF